MTMNKHLISKIIILIVIFIRKFTERKIYYRVNYTDYPKIYRDLYFFGKTIEHKYIDVANIQPIKTLYLGDPYYFQDEYIPVVLPDNYQSVKEQYDILIAKIRKSKLKFISFDHHLECPYSHLVKIDKIDKKTEKISGIEPNKEYIMSNKDANKLKEYISGQCI